MAKIGHYEKGYNALQRGEFRSKIKIETIMEKAN